MATSKPRAVTLAAVRNAVVALGALPDRDYVPMALWGSDHWSTFAYLECRIVDNEGIVDKTKMRCDADRHPGLAFRIPGGMGGGSCPTRLIHGVELDDHDDWDAADDLCAAGLIEKHGTGLHPIVKLTEQGELVAAALRAHKGAGGSFGDFRFGG